MEQLTVKMTTYYNDGKPPKVEEVSLWHGWKPFVFYDDSTVIQVTIANRYFNTQDEYNAFIYGVEYVRNILVSFVNL